MNWVKNWPVAPSYTLTCGPVPGPGATTMSSTPSPVTSPVATRTPPLNFASYARKLYFTEPSDESNTCTTGWWLTSAPADCNDLSAALAGGFAYCRRDRTTHALAYPATAR